MQDIMVVWLTLITGVYILLNFVLYIIIYNLPIQITVQVMITYSLANWQRRLNIYHIFYFSVFITITVVVSVAGVVAVAPKPPQTPLVSPILLSFSLSLSLALLYPSVCLSLSL